MTKGPHLRDATHDSPPLVVRRAKGPLWDSPAWLSAPGKAAFRQLLLDIERATPEVLDRIDVPALALLAEHYAIAQAAAKAMRDTGNVPEVLELDKVHGDQHRKTPAWQVFAQATKTYTALAREYGLTLASRTRLELPSAGLPVDDDEDDALDEALR